MKTYDNWPQRVKILKRSGWTYHDDIYPFWEKNKYNRLVEDMKEMSDNQFLIFLNAAEV